MVVALLLPEALVICFCWLGWVVLSLVLALLSLSQVSVVVAARQACRCLVAGPSKELVAACRRVCGLHRPRPKAAM
jgi:hypothetical protein